MDDEIDLRVYINILIRGWRWIVALTLLAGALALVVSWLLPAQYEATAVVVVARPLYQLQFSPAIQNVPLENPLQQPLTGKAVLDLADSDAMLQQVLEQGARDLPSTAISLTSIRSKLKAKIGGDPSIINLSVTDADPQRAARIVNLWAGLYVHQINDLYGQSAEQQKFFEGQLPQAKDDLDKADRALVDFQKQNDSATLQAQLTAKQGALANYLAMEESLKLLLQNVTNLQDQLARRPADAPASLADDLAALTLQMNAFGSSVPMQLQLAGMNGLSNETVSQQAARLADLAKTIEAKQADIEKQAEASPAEIKDLQGQIQQVQIEADWLGRQRDLAQNVYTTLAQKVQETNIAAQETSGQARLASNAAVPDRPANKKFLTYTLIGVALGLVLSVMGVFVLEYFRPSPPK